MPLAASILQLSEIFLKKTFNKKATDYQWLALVTPLRLELRTHRLRVCCSTN